MSDLDEGGCVDPQIGDLVPAFALGGLPKADQDRVAAHLLECDACWQDVQRLEAAVSTLRADRERVKAMLLRDVNLLMGPSSRFLTWLAGHQRFGLTTAAIYGLLFGLAWLVETIYAASDLGHTVWIGSVGSAVVGIASLLGALTMIWVFERRGGRVAGAAAAAVLVAGAALAMAGGYWWLPTRALVEADFQTYPASLGNAKTLFWTLIPGLVLVLLPFATVLGLLRETAGNRHRGVLLLLTADPMGTPPRGVLFLQPRLIFAAGALLVLLDFVGMSWLFDGLVPRPDMALFMALRFTRLVLLCGLLGVGTVWYVRALAELKRESLAGSTLSQPRGQPH